MKQLILSFSIETGPLGTLIEIPWLIQYKQMPPQNCPIFWGEIHYALPEEHCWQSPSQDK